MQRNIPTTTLIILLTTWIAGTSASGQSRSSPDTSQADDRQIMQALVYEMRQLRLAVQRTNVISHRLQITLERLRLQQARVDSDLESNVKAMKFQVGRLEAGEIDARDRESAMSTELQAAQALRSDLQNQMDNMMRELGSP